MDDWLELQTQCNVQYMFIPETSGAVLLKVKAASDAYIALTDGPFERDPITEICIGGWGNTKSSIRRNQKKPYKVKVETLDILNADEYTTFWIRWQDNEVSAGVQGEPPFIKYLDPELHPITHIAVGTGWGAVGDWKIKVSPMLCRSLPVKPIKGGQLRWVTKTANDKLPLDAFIGGYENGEVLYIARALQRPDLLIPGKYAASNKCVVVGWCRELRNFSTCEILCGYNAAWLKTSGGCIPPHAFVVGYEGSESYYVGRSRIEGNLIPGKVLSTHKLCYLPFQDTEIDASSYEILVIPDKLPSAVIWRASQALEDTECESEYSDYE